MRRSVKLVCVLLLVIGGVVTARADRTSVTVVDFYNLSQDARWEWLSRGMADMLITDLSTLDRFRVIDREGLQRYLDEMELQGSGLLSDETLIDIGRLAGVDKLVFGTYRVDRNDRISVQATIVDIATRVAEVAVNLTGEVDEVLELEDELAERLASKFGAPLSKREKQDLVFAWTESLDATAHFYTALGHYDRGRLPLALAEAKTAEKIDSNYLPARFWSGRLYVELAEYEHAELYLTGFLRDARERRYKHAYVVHASLLLAQLYEKFLETPEKAIPVLEALRRDKLDSFEQANVRFQLAGLYRQTGRYNAAYDLFVSLYRDTRDIRLDEKFGIPYRSVALLPSLRKLRKMAIEHYQSSYLLAFYNSEAPPEPQAGMVVLTPQEPEYSRTEHFQGVFSYGADAPNPLFIAPKGQRFRAFTFEFRGKQREISVFPLLHQNRRFDLIGQKSSLPDPEGGVSRFRYEANQEMVQAFLFDAYVKDQPEGKFTWRVKAEFMPADAAQPGSIEYWHELLRKNVRYPLLFDTPGHTGEKTTMAEGVRGELRVIYDTRDREEQNDRGKDSDLWLLTSPDKTSWQGPRRLVELNSVADDFDPVLFQDGRQRLVLTFASGRGGKNELWLAMSHDASRWQRPRRIAIRDDAGNDVHDLITPAVFQDSKGVYRLAAFHTAKQRILVTSSKDLLNWQEAVFIELPDITDRADWRDKATLDYLEDNGGVYRMIVSGNFAYDSGAYLGASINARDWQFRPAGFKSDSHPSLIHANDGRYALMLASGVDPTVSEHPIHYASQLRAKSWDTWEEPVSLPRIHYLADYFMKPSTIYQDREGFYWIANHRHYGEQFQLYRLREFPATTIPEVFPASPNAHPYARVQLRREELALKARKAGDEELALCLRKARHYESCLDAQAVSAERSWWKFW